MEAAALFLIVIAAIVIAAVGFVVYAVAMRQRQRQLHPREDRVEGPGEDGERRERPEHVRVGREQGARFLPHR